MPSETILLVDDSQETQRLLGELILRPIGYNIIYAGNGRHGLEMTAKHNPDLIMLDNNMPQMSGLEMLKALHADGNDTPVIFMTVFGSEKVAVTAFRLGVRDYLNKPFTPKIARETINRALMASRLAREKELLSRNLIAAKTVRQTVTTLAHHINNHLMIINGGLTLLEESIQSRDKQFYESIKSVLQNSQNSSCHIEAVLHILQQIADIEPDTYHQEVKMLNIEQTLEKELDHFQTWSLSS